VVVGLDGSSTGAAPAGAVVGSLVDGAPAVAGLEGAGIAGLTSDVLAVVGSEVGVAFFFLEKKLLILSRGD